MEELQKTLDKVLLQVEKIDTVENKLSDISEKISGIENRVSNVEGRATSLETNHRDNAPKIAKIDGLEQSCTFLSQQYEDVLRKDAENKTNITALQGDVRKLAVENVKLRGQICNIQNSLDQEKVARNQDAQHARTSLNIKLCGVPIQAGEDEKSTFTPSNTVTFAVITRVCEAAEISLPPNCIDVCHRLGNDSTSPIIIRFHGKSNRFAFFSQRHKLKKITSLDINFRDLPIIVPRDQGRHPPRGGLQQRNPPRSRQPRAEANELATEGSKIYMQEHLTKYTKSLLKVSKVKLHEVFKFPGYIMSGEVRCKKTEEDKFMRIGSISDLKRIMTDHLIAYEETDFDNFDENR